VSVAIPEAVLQETAKWMVDFRDYWHDELPTQLHTFAIGPGGTPDWHPDFARWLGVDFDRDGSKRDRQWRDNPEPRVRTTRAFRKLRKKAVREFEVCYRIIILGDPIVATCDWLNERAARNDIPLPEPPRRHRGYEAHYDMNDTLLLLVSGVGKLIQWW
jgi:hypothetical protein